MQFSSTICSALIGLCLSSISVVAAPGLSLAVSGSKNFAGVQDFKIITSLVNTGDETLKLLRDPRTVLSLLPTDRFAISNAEGASPAFTGARAKFVPEYVVKNNIEDAFVVLEPGASFELEHDLSTSYNFTVPGKGTYDIRVSGLFLHIDPATNEIVELQANEEAPLTASFTGTLSIARRHTKRITYQSCSSTRQSQLVSAASAAASYASSAASYLSSHTSSTTRYVSWFGTYDSGRHTTVLNHFNAIKGYPFSGSVTYDCTCTDSGTYAYVYPNQFGTIYLCGAFWSAPNTGTDSRGGTLIHESSHFTDIAGTQDYVYGQSGARNLARTNPTRAIANADSHEYFAENNPAQA
ncbi:hypothetical protein AAF712_003261 [Marasmius tenuissimus]|uniref:Lysine-specific metallo-endopeptidase domain-containing protein n=1 Tax=Marasmius tenuissimus TaxID=585030 RepID=A0ABR3A9B6_9AGAR|nr:hypothetical protein PM082_012068 [Marasmius tenuissimus]